MGMSHSSICAYLNKTWTERKELNQNGMMGINLFKMAMDFGAVTEICPMHDNEQCKVPCFNSGCTNAQNNNQTYNCCQQKNLLMWMKEQPNWLGFILPGKQDQQCSTAEVSWKYGCILLWFLFYESKMDQN